MPYLRHLWLLERWLLVTREIAMRERVYPRQVGNGRITQRLADRELALMRAVLTVLRDAS